MINIIHNLLNNNDYEDKLLKKYKECRKLNKSIKILAISDTHGDLYFNKQLQKKLKNQKYDLCCVLGDITDRDYEIILKYVKKEKLVAILGNHDRYDLLNKYNIYNLHGNVIEVNGIRIAGVQGSFRYKDEEFPSFTHKESIKFLDKIDEVDILLSHDGPFLKNNNKPVHDGLKGITYYLYKNRVPYNIHGHNHESKTKRLKNGTISKEVYLIENLNIKI